MSTANWLTLIATVVALAATWGGLLVRVRIAEKSIDQFDKARSRQGERIGVVEERLATLLGAERRPRRTRPIPIHREPEESGAADDHS